MNSQPNDDVRLGFCICRRAPEHRRHGGMSHRRGLRRAVQFSAVTATTITAAGVLLASFAAPVGAAAGETVTLDPVLEPVRVKNRLPALAAAVVQNGQTVACGAVGFRKDGSHQRVTLEDKWHIGSCTKSMTAVLAGMLVDEGRWNWDMKVTELFPDLISEIDPEWREATLLHFLTHYSGAGDEDSFNPGLLARVNQPPLEQRAKFIREFLVEHGPAGRPGAEWKYDNANYIVVGHAIELKLRQPWETVIRERLFEPLKMDSAGFGPPARGNDKDQPWGHVLDEEGNFKLIPPDLAGESPVWADNPASLAPAGTVHCSIGDLAKYAAWQLRGARGKGTLLKAATFKRLHTRFKKDGDYACGWNVVHRDWAGGDALFHGGSNGTFMTAIWLAPKKNFAVVVCANVGGKDAQAAVDDTVRALIEKFLTHD
jgi:CubicO group peptidase (beta-lactamase class C family)